VSDLTSGKAGPGSAQMIMRTSGGCGERAHVLGLAQMQQEERDGEASF